LLSAKFHVALIVTVLRLPHGEGPFRAFIRSLDVRRPPVKKIALEEHVRDETQLPRSIHLWVDLQRKFSTDGA